MRASELRIGNWIYDPVNKTEFQIDCFLGTDYCTNKCEFETQEFDAKLEECEPIALTEEWLIKFGFKPEGEGYSLNNYLVCSFKDFSDGSSEYSLYEWDSYNEVEVCIKGGIKYVHQLQNLFFALTNEELL